MLYFINKRGCLMALALLMTTTPPMMGNENKLTTPGEEKQDDLTCSRREIHEKRMYRAYTLMTRQLGRIRIKTTINDLVSFHATAAELCHLESEYLERDDRPTAKSRRSISSVERDRHGDIMGVLEETRDAAKLALSLYESGKGKAATAKINEAEKAFKQATRLMEARRKEAVTTKLESKTK